MFHLSTLTAVMMIIIMSMNNFKIKKGVGIDHYYKHKVRRQDLDHALASTSWLISLMITYHYHSWVQYKYVLVKSTRFYPYFGFSHIYLQISCQSRIK